MPDDGSVKIYKYKEYPVWSRLNYMVFIQGSYIMKSSTRKLLIVVFVAYTNII